MTSLLSTISIKCRYFKYQRNQFRDSKQQDLPRYALCPQGKWKTDSSHIEYQNVTYRTSGSDDVSDTNSRFPKANQPTKQDSTIWHLEDRILQINTNSDWNTRIYSTESQISEATISYVMQNTDEGLRLQERRCGDLNPYHRYPICLRCIKQHWQ